jgi:hypothetical protein
MYTSGIVVNAATVQSEPETDPPGAAADYVFSSAFAVDRLCGAAQLLWSPLTKITAINELRAAGWAKRKVRKRMVAPSHLRGISFN